MYLIIFNHLMSYYKVDTLVTSTNFKKLNFAKHPLPMYMSYSTLSAPPKVTTGYQSYHFLVLFYSFIT